MYLAEAVCGSGGGGDEALRRALLRAGRLLTGAVAAAAAAGGFHHAGRFAARADATHAPQVANAIALRPAPAAGRGSKQQAGDALAVLADGGGGDAGGSGNGGGGLVPAVMERLLGGASSNQITQSGVALMVLGAALAAARSALLLGLEFARRRVVVTAEIDSRDDAYRWLMYYLSQQPSFKDARCVSVHTSLATTFGTSPLPASAAAASSAPSDGGGSGSDGAGAGGAKAAAAAAVAYLPAPGFHLLMHKGRPFGVWRRRAAGNPQMAANARLLMETLVLTTPGTSRAPLEALVAEAAAAFRSSQRRRTGVWSVDQDGYWQLVGSRPVRPLSSVVLPAGEAAALLADCREFLAAEGWYARRGIPWRRGYLLHGPPGSGKTSLVTGLAGALGLDIYVTTLSSPAMSDEALRGLLNQAAPRALLLLEDVDAAFTEARAAGEGLGGGAGGGGGGGGRLTFSGLLNAIDGVAAQEGRLVFMTTNHIERLDPALIRPGRVDVRCQFQDASRAQAEALFLSFYADRAPATAATAAAAAALGGAAAGSGGGGGGGPAAALASIDDDSAGALCAFGAVTAAAAVPAPAGGADGAAAVPAPAGGADGAPYDDAELRRLARAFGAALAAGLKQGTPERQPAGGADADAGAGAGASAPLEGVSMAALQGLLMRFKRDPRGVAAAAGRLAAEAGAAAARRKE